LGREFTALRRLYPLFLVLQTVKSI